MCPLGDLESFLVPKWLLYTVYQATNHHHSAMDLSLAQFSPGRVGTASPSWGHPEPLGRQLAEDVEVS